MAETLVIFIGLSFPRGLARRHAPQPYREIALTHITLAPMAQARHRFLAATAAGEGRRSYEHRFAAN
jgi:hypothetical protein